MINKKLKLGIFFLIGILLMTTMVLAYYRTQTNYAQYGNYASGFFGGVDRTQCEAGQDFILQTAPFGCEPSIVRSDLLEEQDVPVFCQISATQMNPLINVEAINSISIAGDYPSEVATVGFHPAKAALNPYQNQLTQPVIMENIGYSVIVLRRQPNESAIPDFVEGNLTAIIRYNVKNAFGVGQSTFYLPVMKDEADWEKNYKRYGFWDGRAYLRAEGIYGGQATLSIYSDEFRNGILGQGNTGKRLYSTTTLQEGETSNELSIPGFDFCLATMRLKLLEVKNPDTTARFRVDGENVEVVRGERFLENRCQVLSLETKGINQEVSVNCRVDKGDGSFNLKIIPKISLSINGIIKDNVSIGDFLYATSKKERIYLAYAGTEGNTGKQENLYAYFIKIPGTEYNLDKLTKDQINSAKIIAEGYRQEEDKGENILETLEKAGKFYASVGMNFYRWIQGENFYGINYGKPETRFGKEIDVLGFVGPINVYLSDDIKTYFENAKQDYEEIVNSYPDETNDNLKNTLGEEALHNLIDLANQLNQKAEMQTFCKIFEEDYSNSKKSIEVCDDLLKISSTTASVASVLIDNNLRRISFEGVYEPSREEYGVNLRVKDPDGNEINIELGKNDIRSLNSETNEYVKLVGGLEENSARIETNIKKTILGSEGLGKVLGSREEKLDLNSPVGFESGYIFTLTKINLKKVAKVSVIPNVDFSRTEADFNFRIPIDKRDIKLSPEKTQEKIEKLNNSIKKWEDISDGLGTVVKGLKTSCLATGAVLTAKNYIENSKGKGIARGEVMRGESGWYERCANLVNQEGYSSQEECLIKNSDKIEGEVDILYGFMSNQQKSIQGIQEKYLVQETRFGSEIVDEEGFVGEYSGNVKSLLENNLENTFEDPEGKEKTINIDDIKTVLSLEGWKENNFEIDQLREMELYTTILNSNPSPELKETAQKRLYSTLLNVQENSEGSLIKFSLLGELNNNGMLSNVGGDIYGDVNSITGVYRGGISGSGGFGNIPADVPVEFIGFKNEAYFAELEAFSSDSYRIKNLYYSNGTLITDSSIGNKIKNRIDGFKKYDETSYQNKYKNPEVRYYETEPYAGNPAIVPFDRKNGWYVATKQTLSVFGGIRAYDESGVARSWYLCNVGKNGFEDNVGGDDICELINTFTGQSYNQFPGISDKGKTLSLMNAASKAIQAAQRQHSRGVREVNIPTYPLGITKKFKVGNPAVDIPDIQCQDFMSPKDCNLLFNVCDPVICPSSRCDFGGNYPVKDVVQSGIIGSIALCLPNYQENIYIPVCLTGVKAGIDDLLSVSKSYQSCLQESLDTGQTVGICDEVQSIYMCEFFYKQGIPLAKLGIPKLTEALVGANSRGGGEYLGVQDAWERAEKSVDYLTQYYAANSYKAFKARSIEEAGQDFVCNSFISLNYPGGNLLDTLTTPDSPSQFHGRFSEIPFTSVTNPPISQYKVFYHVYAGKDRGAYYRVYLRGDSSSSFYQDNIFRVDVASGYVGVGDYASETRDFTAPSGYKQLCINVNGQEECGFGQISTSFAVNYIEDQYLAEQSKQTDIKTAEACVSGTASVYNLLDPNIQSGAESALNPSIYNKGIIRICATQNPGLGTDSNAGIEGSRWAEVGVCGSENLKCWLDQESVGNVIDFTNIEEDVLKTTSDNYLDILKNEGGYIDSASYESRIEEIEDSEKTDEEKISLITETIERVFLNSEKSYLLLLRGNVYSNIAFNLYNSIKREQKDLKDLSKEIGEGGDKLEEEIFLGLEDAEEIMELREKLKVESPLKFEFKDGFLAFETNVCYSYFDGKWYWTKNCGGVGVATYSPTAGLKSINEWILVSSLENPYGRNPGKGNQEFITSLRSKNFDQGFKLLIDRTINEEAELVASASKLDSSIFTLSYSSIGNVYFKFEDGKWNWNVNNLDKGEEGWLVSGEFFISGLGPDGNELHFWYEELTYVLKNKDFYEGSKLIFLVINEEENKGDVSEETSAKDVGVDSKFDVSLQSLLQEQISEYGWVSWDGITNSVKKDYLRFTSQERITINEAENCGSCGDGFPNICDKRECVAVGFKLREELNSDSMCVYTGGITFKCEEVPAIDFTGDVLGVFDEGETCSIIEVLEESESVSSPQKKVLNAVTALKGTPSGDFENCFKSAEFIYESAGVGLNCVYAAESGTTYNIGGEVIEVISSQEAIFQVATFPEKDCGLNIKDSDIRESEKLNEINPGDFLSYAYTLNSGHNVIFIGWVNEGERIAKVFDWNGPGKTFDYNDVDLSDDRHPVYMFWEPKLV